MTKFVTIGSMYVNVDAIAYIDFESEPPKWALEQGRTIKVVLRVQESNPNYPDMIRGQTGWITPEEAGDVVNLLKNTASLSGARRLVELFPVPAKIESNSGIEMEVIEG